MCTLIGLIFAMCTLIGLIFHFFSLLAVYLKVLILECLHFCHNAGSLYYDG